MSECPTRDIHLLYHHTLQLCYMLDTASCSEISIKCPSTSDFFISNNSNPHADSLLSHSISPQTSASYKSFINSASVIGLRTALEYPS